MPARAPSVLVVDDYADAADTLAEVLTAFEYCARAVYSLDEALVALAADDPSVVILEPEMGHGAGWELAARFGPGPRPVLVAVTTNRASAERCRAAGFTAHLVKPCSPAELLEVLVEVVRPEPGATVIHLHVT